MSFIRFHIVDVFTETPYAGNQLCVVPDADGLTDNEMQQIAAEIGFSETTFLSAASGLAAYRIRIFTPTKEIPFAGHPSLGSAYVMAGTGRIELSEPATHIYQQLKIGLLAIELFVSGGEIVKVAMEQGEPVLSEPLDAVRIANVMSALSLEHVGETRSGSGSGDAASAGTEGSVRLSSTGLPALIVPVEDEEQLYSASPGIGLKDTLADAGAELCYVYCRKKAPSHHYVARAFAPALGIVEDPATGSAAGALGAYLSLTGQLGAQGGAVYITIDQGHAIGRPSRIEVELRRKGKADAVSGKPGIWVGGQCAAVAEGRFFL